ncbi:hypothetical protein [Jiulongibacter sediminis]|uniref:Uncharacterized protein n=1 Tax=Jiulongibacter sediminis TaxID=1605367 RepID=A0A0P7C403_9BACT|nr:hypothetical protein [Jiulongibacter sediminis]KPM47897.1 hypothetical protein AFM12_11730 [Jiulongibacter sediminis]TBX24080.1 hypothetical protein TK44_11740 [Jiulongibacter sediminis]
MTYKWNSADAQQYAEQFASLLCDEFFKNKESISGAEVLQISEIKQLNLLVIKNLYDKWQEENTRLKSPFFDYSNPEVKEALESFMNVLSRHISVNQKTFQSLLSKATFDTLQLAAEPQAFFEGQLRNLPDFKLSKSWIDKNSKYFVFNKHILNKLGEKTGDINVFANEAIQWLKEIIASEGTEDPSDLLADLNNILPLYVGKAAGKTSFFDEALNGSASTNPVRLKPTEEPLPEIPAKPIPVKVKIDKPVALQEEAMARLNEKHSGTSVTLNERIISENTKNLLDLHQKKKISSLKEGISFNQRHLFVRNLFAGDLDAFNQTLEALETYSSYDQAINHLEQNTVKQFQWKAGSEEAGEFYAHLERKFA